ncbi:hypothetical protein [Flagellimonas sp.]|uniref:hypothetical protein n=1 Tax=Flagellimonas sp. TaxID=2058762 RepID=UPI003B500C25
MKKYSVSEITIFSDSTYVQKFHKLDDKGQRNNYKHFDYNLTGGKFKKKGDFYAFSQIGTDSLLDDHFRIKKEKLTYYYQKGNGRFKKGAVFKEVENQPQRPIDYIREIFDYVYYRYLDKDLVSESKTVEIKYGDYISGRINLKITEFFYPDTKELVRLKIASGDYPEYTDNYFYNNGELVFAESWIDNEKYNGEKVKLFIRDGKPLNKPKAKKKIFQQIIESANNYMMDYRKASSQE